MLDSKICVIGIWHLGCVTSACLADLGYSVIGVDQDARRVAGLNEGIPPLYEPGLADLLKKNIQAGRLSYSTDLEKSLSGADFAIVAFDTSVDDNDEADLTEILERVKEAGKYLKNGAVVLVTSQVPVGTCSTVQSMIKQVNPELRFEIAYTPENLRLGQAIESFNTQQRIVIGADKAETLDKVEALFRPLKAVKLRMNLRSAEMTKHALNALLGLAISFGNEMANLCDELGADALKVVEALRTDERIGKRLPLLPGLGFSGATLARDLKVLQQMGEKTGYKTYLVDAVLKVNREQNHLVRRKLEKEYGSIAGLTIGILGLTYKPGTSTLRRSAALEIISELVQAGAAIKACDPKAEGAELALHPELQFCPDAYETAQGADALVLVTEWPEFKDLDYTRIKSSMRKAVFIDAKNMLDEEQMVRQGFIYYGVGRGR